MQHFDHPKQFALSLIIILNLKIMKNTITFFLKQRLINVIRKRDKKILAVCLTAFSSLHGHAQNIQDTIPKEQYSYDYSNRQYTNMFYYYQDYAKQKSSNLIVINNKKIVSMDDKEFLSLIRSDSIASLTIIKDENSECAVKCILLIETK